MSSTVKYSEIRPNFANSVQNLANSQIDIFWYFQCTVVFFLNGNYQDVHIVLFIRERVKKPRPSSFAIIVHESYPILTPYIDEKAFSNMFSILLKCLLRNSS